MRRIMFVSNNKEVNSNIMKTMKDYLDEGFVVLTMNRERLLKQYPGAIIYQPGDFMDHKFHSTKKFLIDSLLAHRPHSISILNAFPESKVERFTEEFCFGNTHEHKEEIKLKISIDDSELNIFQEKLKNIEYLTSELNDSLKEINNMNIKINIGVNQI